MDYFRHTIENRSIINMMIIIIFKSLFSALRVAGRESQAIVVMVYIFSPDIKSYKKRGITLGNKSWLVLVLLLIGWEIDEGFLCEFLSLLDVAWVNKVLYCIVLTDGGAK